MLILLLLAKALPNTLRRSVFARATLFGLSLPVGLLMLAYFSNVKLGDGFAEQPSPRGTSQWLRAEHESEAEEKEMGAEFREGLARVIHQRGNGVHPSESGGQSVLEGVRSIITQEPA